VENKGAKPYIEFRKNAKPGGKNDAWNRLYHTYSLNREDFYQLSQALERGEHLFDDQDEVRREPAK
jgi:hypothetical protein